MALIDQNEGLLELHRAQLCLQKIDREFIGETSTDGDKSQSVAEWQTFRNAEK